ncbi:MAG: hypothetical protein M3680_31860 [Myxococcota bacterium]|nr:hypothetical protein [Myxococcota bacterium]
MLRWTLAAAAAAAACGVGCGVQIGSGADERPDAANPDARPPVDGGVDAPVDARPCTGGDGAMMSGSTCFLLFTTPRSFADARAACAGLGTTLAVPADAAKHASARTLAGGRDVFIGLSDEATEMTFVWVDATPLVFTAWNPEEPNNGSATYEEDCVVIAGTSGTAWDDRPCAPGNGAPLGSGSYAYMCQF